MALVSTSAGRSELAGLVNPDQVYHSYTAVHKGVHLRGLRDLQESKQFDGQVLVAREAERHQTGGASHVVDTYEPVAGALLSCKSCTVLLI